MRFSTTIEQTGTTAMEIEVPASIVEALGPSRRLPVTVTINGYTYRNSVAPLGGRYMIGVELGHRGPAGVKGGETVEVDLELDTAPREITVPDDLPPALDALPAAPQTPHPPLAPNKSWHVLQVTGTKAETHGGGGSRSRSRRCARTDSLAPSRLGPAGRGGIVGRWPPPTASPARS